MKKSNIKQIVSDILIAPQIERYTYTILYSTRQIIYSNRKPNKNPYTIPHIIFTNSITNRKWANGCWVEVGQYKKEITKRVKEFLKGK